MRAKGGCVRSFRGAPHTKTRHYMHTVPHEWADRNRFPDKADPMVLERAMLRARTLPTWYWRGQNKLFLFPLGKQDGSFSDGFGSSRYGDASTRTGRSQRAPNPFQRSQIVGNDNCPNRKSGERHGTHRNRIGSALGARRPFHPKFPRRVHVARLQRSGWDFGKTHPIFAGIGLEWPHDTDTDHR